MPNGHQGIVLFAGATYANTTMLSLQRATP